MAKSNETLTNKIETVEKRIHDLIDKKQDILGFIKDKKIRDELLDIELAIFGNMCLFRNFKIEEAEKCLMEAFDKVDFENIFKQKNDG